METRQNQMYQRYRDANLKPVQVWIYADDTETHEKIMKHDKRAEVRKARQK